MALEAGTIIWCGPDDELGFAEARDWIKTQGYSKDDARMYRDEGSICVELLSDNRQ